ncbi:hypothetical protein [Desulfovibrio gilichinskyi]|uniref:Uncharacterized protein n=1 Tax=Desulfovibrio gilichinskyi TaxID=1519643 RepID=A0A1X7D7G9_9BACT|nr:hypothetical protein [Desulfovibrio gilichinskyi]SMF09938.1 hypothetical protein SAMN06295933_1734 [Desulfovibrio gilichinskyi]
MGKKNEFYKYFKKESRLVGVLLLFFIPFSLLLSDWENFDLSKEFLTKNWNIFEPIVGILTLIVALALFVVNKRKSWEDSLPKVLTAEFVYAKDGSLLMKAERFPVASEGDLRAWGQQLGAQILFGERSFQYFKLRTSSSVNDDGLSKDYVVIFYLEDIPRLLKPVHEVNEWVLLKEDGNGKVCRTRLSFNSSSDEGKPFERFIEERPKGEVFKNQKIFVKEGNLIS